MSFEHPGGGGSRFPESTTLIAYSVPGVVVKSLHSLSVVHLRISNVFKRLVSKTPNLK